MTFTLVTHRDYANCAEITPPFPLLLLHQNLSSAKLVNKYFYIILTDTGMDCHWVPRGCTLLLHQYTFTGCRYLLLYPVQSSLVSRSSFVGWVTFVCFKDSLEQTSCIHTKQRLTLALLLVSHCDPLNKRHCVGFVSGRVLVVVEGVTGVAPVRRFEKLLWFQIRPAFGQD